MLDTSVRSEDSAPKIRFFGQILAPAIFAVLLLIVAVVAFSIIAGLIAANHGETPDEIGKQVKNLINSFYGTQITSLLLYGALYVFADQRAIAAGHESLRQLYVPVRWLSLLKCAGAGAGSALLVMVTITLWSKLASTALIPTPSEAGLMPGSRGTLDADKYLRIALSAFTVGLVAPFVEEIFFRGLVQRWLAQRLPGGRAVLASAVIFALFHFKLTLHFNSWGVVLTLGIGCLGAATGHLFYKYRSLWPGFVLHASYNLSLIAFTLMGHR